MVVRVQRDAATIVADVLEAWEKQRPFKTFFGLTLEQCKVRVKPFTDARLEIADLEKRLSHAASKRDATAKDALDVIQGVVSAVKGDPEEGQYGALYAAMGYVPKNQRATGLTRRGKKPEPVTAGGEENEDE